MWDYSSHSDKEFFEEFAAQAKGKVLIIDGIKKESRLKQIDIVTRLLVKHQRDINKGETGDFVKVILTSSAYVSISEPVVFQSAVSLSGVSRLEMPGTSSNSGHSCSNSCFVCSHL